jgi:hypothetical protein
MKGVERNFKQSLLYNELYVKHGANDTKATALII